MTSHIPTVLAISLGKKCFGIAVFTGAELTHFSRQALGRGTVRTLLRTQLTSIFRQMFTSFSPQVIVVRAPSQYQKSSTTVAPTTRVIEREAKHRQIPVISISLAEIKARLCADKPATQAKAFLHLARRYPELRPLLIKTSKWQQKYHRPVLAAVSAGAAYLDYTGEIK